MYRINHPHGLLYSPLVSVPRSLSYNDRPQRAPLPISSLVHHPRAYASYGIGFKRCLNKGFLRCNLNQTLATEITLEETPMFCPRPPSSCPVIFVCVITEQIVIPQGDHPSSPALQAAITHPTYLLPYCCVVSINRIGSRRQRPQHMEKPTNTVRVSESGVTGADHRRKILVLLWRSKSQTLQGCTRVQNP